MKTRSMQWMCAAVLAAALAAPPAMAQQATAGMPGEWLSRYSGPRTLGLGGAFVAVADDALGVLWNPAGLSAMDQNELRFENSRLFEETQINGVSFAVPGSRLPSFGVTILSMGSGEFQRTNDMNDPLGTFSTGETAYLLTAAKAFSTRFALGANVKMVSQSVEDFSAGGFGIDLGGWYVPAPGVRLGASVANLGGPTVKLRDVAETYPVEMRGGVSAHVFGGRGLVTAEINHSSNGLGTRLHGGGEYWIQPTLALRAGVDHDYGTGGMSLRVGPQYRIDYGVADHPLGMTHRIGISYRFGGFFAASHAEPGIFSPTGERAVTRISLNARTKADAASWTLEIRDKAEQVVRRFGGPGQPPAHIQWDGKDDAGMPLADGVYRYQLTVRDGEGRQLLGAIRIVEISSTGPQGAVPLVPIEPTPEQPR